MSDVGPDRSILIVDDEEAIRSSLSRMLQRENYHVEVASNPKDALDRLQASQYGLILTDVKMAGGSGLDLVQTVSRSLPRASPL